MRNIVAALIICAIGSAIFFYNNGGEAEFGTLLRLIPWALLATACILILRDREKFVKEIQLGVWIVILASLMFLYISRDDLSRQGQRLLAALVPGQPIQLGSNSSEVLIYKNENSHFETRVRINGRDIKMLVDTGATDIVLASEDARLLGFQPENLAYDVPVRTAAGFTNTAAVTLNSLSIGPIRRSLIPALVSQPNELEQSLLGMSFISTLKSFHLKSDELRLED